MGSDYTIDVKHRLNLGATPVDVKTLSFSTPKRTIASVLSETHSVLLFSIGDTFPTPRILVNEDPIEISGGDVRVRRMKLNSLRQFSSAGS